jgi:hypothetical protein
MSNKPQDDKNVMPTEPNLVAPSYAKEFTKSLGYELRAQHQQGSEPVPVVECYDDGSVNGGLRWIPYTGLNHAIEYGDKFYTGPPQANALVAAGYRKAAEIIRAKVDPDKTQISEQWNGICNDFADEILAAIPADAEAALREVSDKVAEAIKGAFKDEIASAKHFNVPGVADALEAFQDTVVTFAVNSVLGEGGK